MQHGVVSILPVLSYNYGYRFNHDEGTVDLTMKGDL